MAYNSDSHVLPTIRSNGVLLAQVVPQGGRISGQSSVIELDGWNWEDAGYKFDQGVHVRFPSVYAFGFDPVLGFSQRKNDNFTKQLAELEGFFKEAQAYTKKDKPMPRNLKFEAMRDVFSLKKTLFIHANLVKEMTEAVLLGKKYDCKMVIVGGTDAWLMTNLLKENNVSVILNEPQRLPNRNDEDYDQPFKTAAQLKEAGIPFCLSISNGGWKQRNLPLMAGQTVGHGLAYEDAVMAITSAPAKILGIENTVGTLEVGKDATLIVTEGDALDMRTSKVIHAFIRGKEIDLNNKQKDLYRRFQTKYERQKSGK
ncbi:MAG: amidohydrolase family protein [Saprospiraceae bacterium]|nr:amidohydrolase family protein [Saprospiraceae bacterium]